MEVQMIIQRKGKRQVITVPEYAEMFGISRGAAYAAAKAKTIPTITIGRRIVVPIPALERLLEGRVDE
jgi:hypothetical protein